MSPPLLQVLEHHSYDCKSGGGLTGGLRGWRRRSGENDVPGRVKSEEVEEEEVWGGGGALRKSREDDI